MKKNYYTMPKLIFLVVFLGEVLCIKKAIECDWSDKTSYKAEAIYTVSFFTGIGAVVGWFNIEDK